MYKGNTAGSESGYGLSVTADGYVYFKVSDSITEGKYLKGDKHLELHQWYHIIGTADRDGLQKIYVNGVFDKSKDISSIGNIDYSYTLTIGALRGIFRFWNGLIDEVRIYNRALSADEIQALYNSSVGRYK